MPTLASTLGLTLEDFSFARGVLSGMEPRKAFLRFYANRHFDIHGNPIIPHGLEINKRANDLVHLILAAGLSSNSPDTHAQAVILREPLVEDTASEPAKVQAHMEFTAWVESLPEDMYGENELPQRFQDYLDEQGVVAVQPQRPIIDRAQALNRKIKALNFLQSQLASLPLPENEISVWFAQSISRSFKRLGINDMRELQRYISEQGRHWHRDVRGLGPGRAARIEAWIDSHAASLGQIDRSSALWHSTAPLATEITPLQRAPEFHELLVRPGELVATPRNEFMQRRFGIVPLELLAVPSELDGRNGMFRTSTPNHLGARNDYEAIQRWLGTYLSSDKVRTLEAYRREVERFYLWCLLDARCALSSIALSHAQSYQAFLRNIPERYITTKRVARESPLWRPWRGQLTPQSQNYAIGVIDQLFTVLHKNAYVTGNPFESIRPNNAGAKQRTMDTTRTLHSGDLALVREMLDKLQGLRSNNLRTAALARRMRLILHLAVTTGLRLSEIVSTNLTTLRKAIVDGIESDDWMITVIGKGSKPRDVPLNAQVLAYIYEHHADWERLMPHAAQRLQAFRAAPPLVAVLQSPVRSDQRDITDETVLANDNAALSRSGVAMALKTFFRQLAKDASTPQQKERILKFSTHWLRHTFAHEVLRANEGDEGLKLAQQLLGHASISTTAEYVKQDESAKVKAARKVNPLAAC